MHPKNRKKKKRKKEKEKEKERLRQRQQTQIFLSEKESEMKYLCCLSFALKKKVLFGNKLYIERERKRERERATMAKSHEKFAHENMGVIW